MDKNGFGKCQKGAEAAGKLVCYVNQHSTCKDRESTNEGLHYSFEACNSK